MRRNELKIGFCMYSECTLSVCGMHGCLRGCEEGLDGSMDEHSSAILFCRSEVAEQARRAGGTVLCNCR